MVLMISTAYSCEEGCLLLHARQMQDCADAHPLLGSPFHPGSAYRNTSRVRNTSKCSKHTSSITSCIPNTLAATLSSPVINYSSSPTASLILCFHAGVGSRPGTFAVCLYTVPRARSLSSPLRSPCHMPCIVIDHPSSVVVIENVVLVQIQMRFSSPILFSPSSPPLLCLCIQSACAVRHLHVSCPVRPR